MSGMYATYSPTAILVGKLLHIPVWRKKYPKRTAILIRWGTTAKGPIAQKTYNKAKAIRIARNKYECRKLLQDTNIPVPLLTTEKFPLVGRPFTHAGGKKFWFCRNQQEVKRARTEGAQYFSQYYPKTTEYRVHIGSGTVIAYQKKIPSQESQYNWNHRSGSFFVSKYEGERRKEIIQLAKDAVRIVGLDFGAVDILADPGFEGFPTCVVCEINTAPKVEGNTLEAYVHYFSDLVQQVETTDSGSVDCSSNL